MAGKGYCLVAGFGCRQGCSLEELRLLLSKALITANASPANLQGIATFEGRLQAPGLMALATELGLTLAGYSAPAMAPFEALLSHRSAVSWHHTGCQGVAESAALAHCASLAGSVPELLVTRLQSPSATVALAVSLAFPLP